MDLTERKITKIAREASKLAVRTLKEDGIGTAEYDFIHLVRHHPGITQAEVREQLRVDKGAAARRAASLEAKGYLIRQANPKDGRSQLLFATEKAEGLRNSKAQVETTFYEWLLAELPEAEKIAFCKTLDTIYRRSKQESRAGFPHITALTEQGVNVPCEVDVYVTGDAGIQELNREMRQGDRPTDVLSFPALELAEGELPAEEDADVATGFVPLGDMAISLERVKAQAKEYGHSNRRELAYLAVHSVLHLLGYDHMDEGPQKARMRAREEAVMAVLGLERK